jgi:hypothetical protein
MRFSARLAVQALVLGLGSLSAPLTVPAFALNPPAAAAHTPVPMAAHRALYKLALNSTRGSRDVTAATGTMGYEVVDACDGWASRQRLRMVLTNGDGQDVTMESDYATWESKDGLSLRFHMVEKTDGEVTTQTDGSAKLTRDGGPGEVSYTMPKDKKLALPAGTLFPMRHTESLIAAARAGKKFFAVPLFDGTSENGVEDSSSAIIDWKEPMKTEQAMLSPLSSTRVRIAFFDHASPSSTPTYEAAMRYWENGVADDMLMDFGDFVMHATLSELSPVPRRC